MTAHRLPDQRPDQPTAGDADLAELAAAIAEPARAAILLALIDGRALPATMLAAEAGVAPSTASTHLSRLLAAGLIRCRPQGRHRYYELAGPPVAELLELMAGLAPPRPVRSLRQANRVAALRAGRTCYDHLAGRLGVELFASLVGHGEIVGGDGLHHASSAVGDRLSAPGRDLAYRLTPAGRARLADLGVELGAADADGSTGLRYCVDWTEQRHHLAGAAGKSVAIALFDQGWVVRAPAGRAVRVTDAGRAALIDGGLTYPS